MNPLKLKMYSAGLIAVLGWGFYLGVASVSGQGALPDQKIILVHGLFSSPDTWSTVLANWPSEKPYIKSTNLKTPATTSKAAIASQAVELNSQVSGLTIGQVMIGHSQGGLVARRYIRDHPSGPVRSLITVATPNRGAPLAERTGSAGNYLVNTVNTLARGPCTWVPPWHNYYCWVPLPGLSLWQDVVAGWANEFLPAAVFPALQDLQRGSAFLTSLNQSAEPVKTAAILIEQDIEAEVFKLIAAQTNWSEAASTRLYNTALAFYSTIAANAARECLDPLGGNHHACAVTDAFSDGATALLTSNDTWRSFVSPTGNPNVPSDGIVPLAAESIPSPPSTGSFVINRKLQTGVHHLRQTRDQAVRIFIGGLLENEGLAVILKWHETSPVVRFTGSVSGRTLSVDASSTDNSVGAALEYRWTWGDGTTSAWSTSPTASHTYPVGGGTFWVKVDARQQAINTIKSSSSKSFNISADPATAPVAYVRVSISPTTFGVGETKRAVTTLQAQDGTILTGRSVTWTKSNANVSLTPLGSSADVKGVAQGTATVTATSEGVSGSVTVTITSPPINNASSGGNSLPSSVNQGQFYAVSISMNNTGTNSTWRSSTGYSLAQSSPLTGGWFPASVSMGTSITSPGSRKTFNFNLQTEENANRYWDVFYRMQQNGVAFGASNGKQIWVNEPNLGCTKNCSLALDTEAAVRLVPGGALVGSIREREDTSRRAADEIVQVLSVTNYRLHFEEVAGQKVARIQYFGFLAEPWPVDIEFRLTLHPGTINVGQVRRGLFLHGYAVEATHVDARQITVRVTRATADAALVTGEHLLLDIPLVAVSGRSLPTSLPLVELIVRQ